MTSRPLSRVVWWNLIEVDLEEKKRTLKPRRRQTCREIWAAHGSVGKLKRCRPEREQRQIGEVAIPRDVLGNRVGRDRVQLGGNLVERANATEEVVVGG